MSDLRPEKNYIAGLDGLRALSIILVIFYHANIFLGTDFAHTLIGKFVASGNIGVSCFFVLSGFLISGILLDTREHPKYYKNFFFRRLLRIFPLYYLVLIIAFLLLPEFDHPRAEKWSATDPTLYWFYLSNFYIASVGKFNHGLVDLSWSLSIEEQFYLIWPWVVLWLRPKNLKFACYFGILLSVLSRLYLGWKGGAEIQTYVLTHCRLDGLLLGSLLALEKRNLVNLTFLLNHRLKILILSVFFLYLFKYTALEQLIVREMVNYFAVALGFTCLISLVIEKDYTLFSKPALISVGKYSYGIYLIHYPVQAAFRELYVNKLIANAGFWGVLGYQVLFVLIVTVISYGLAFLSFHLFEKQFLKLKRHFNY